MTRSWTTPTGRAPQFAAAISRRSLIRGADITVAVGVVGFALCILFRVGGEDVSTWTDDLGELIATLLAAGGCAAAAARHRGRGRVAWVALGVSALTWGSGQAMWSWFELVQGNPLPFPSAADVGFLGSVPFAVVAVLCLPAATRNRTTRLRTALDGFTITAALTGVSWATVMGPVFAAGGDGSLATVLSLAYPISDVAICAMVLTFVPGLPRESRSPLLLLSAGLAANAVADSAFAYLTATNGYSGNIFDAGWAAGYMLIALGAFRAYLRPAAGPAGERLPSRVGAFLPYIPVGAAAACTIYQKIAGHIEPVLFACFMVAIALVIVRQATALLDNASLVDRLGRDGLTGLDNREVFLRRVDRALSNSAPPPSVCAALHIDVDDFRRVNDRLGRSVGDQVLAAIGGRLSSCLRPDDLIARIGGDEFGLLLVDVPGIHGVVRVAERLLDVFKEPVRLSDHVVRVKGTMGIAVHETAGDDPVDLLGKAALATFAGKRACKGRHLVYHEGIEVDVQAQIERQAELGQALRLGEFFLEYQPIVDLADGCTVGFESLVRWAHPRLGTLSPAVFIGELEQADLIDDVGAWVLEEAARQVAVWRRELVSDLFVTVNVSSRQLLDDQFPTVVSRVLETGGCPASALILEITESGMVDSPDAFNCLDAIRASGVRVALDDFGTGYSSLAYLQTFPADILKIDKSFIDVLPPSDDRPRVAQALIQLGAALGLTTLAEGVESDGQHGSVRASGCQLGQGYLYGRPMPAAAATARLRAEDIDSTRRLA